MIPVEHKEDIVNNGINFMRSITAAYGADEGMKLWNAIATTLDPDVKGQILFAMLLGDGDTVITVRGVDPNKGPDRLIRIRAIRTVTGIGLSEAKDLSDRLDSGYPIKLTISSIQRVEALYQLRIAGFLV